MTASLPVVYRWTDRTEKIDTDSIAQVVEWCEQFSGNHRLPNDVGLALERAVIGSYQIGYLFNYIKMKDLKDETKIKYIEEGIASVLIHIIASYQMTGRDLIQTMIKDEQWKHIPIRWSKFINFVDSKILGFTKHPEQELLAISELCFKYQRWILYHHMGRTKRWDENALNTSIVELICYLLRFAACFECDMARGFALAMAKIQDLEICRH